MSQASDQMRRVRAIVGQVMDRLVGADDDERRAIAVRLTTAVEMPFLKLLLDGLAGRAKRATSPAGRSGAIRSLLWLGAPGVMRLFRMALETAATPLREAAVEALKREGMALPRSPWVCLYLALKNTRARAGDPRVKAVCAEILASLDPFAGVATRAPVGRPDPPEAASSYHPSPDLRFRDSASLVGCSSHLGSRSPLDRTAAPSPFHRPRRKPEFSTRVSQSPCRAPANWFEHFPHLYRFLVPGMGGADEWQRQQVRARSRMAASNAACWSLAAARASRSLARLAADAESSKNATAAAPTTARTA